MTWLTQANAREDVQSKVSEITTKIDDRRAISSETHEHLAIAQIVGETLAGGIALKKEWFYSSVGIDWGDEDRETWYVSRAPVAATFVGDYVVHWTHWIGRVCTQIREFEEEHGHFPGELVYGPRGREVRKKIGPLVRYQFKAGELVDYVYTDAHPKQAPLAEAPELGPVAPPTTEPTLPSFGLKDIVELRDLAQDDQIRGPMAGIYILTGGPGVGKTSVALHRIPYLLLEQFGQLPVEVPGAPPHFFRTETIHVIVWKEHLVPYLKKCLTDLSFGDVAVHHIEDWVARTLRDYVRMGNGKGQYRIEPGDEPEEFRRMKLGFTEPNGDSWEGLTESLMSLYLTDRDDGEFHNPVANQMVDELQDQIAKLKDLFQSSPLPPRFRDPTANFVATVAGIEAAIQVVRVDLDLLAGEVNQAIAAIETFTVEGRSQRTAYTRMRPNIARARDAVTALRERLVHQLTTDFPTALGDFYKSRIVARADAEIWPSGSGAVRRRRLWAA